MKIGMSADAAVDLPAALGRPVGGCTPAFMYPVFMSLHASMVRQASFE
ncbi:MAG TPA: hypothetical protein VJN96_19925 [Vicinamibacterales bacterium]|nr:hypothetical protein [Vicinamibacterales bacterium]